MFGISRQKYFRIIALFIIIMTFLPLLYNNLPPFIGSFHLYAIIWVGSLLLMFPRVIFQKQYMYLLFYGAVFVFLFISTLWGDMTVWNKKLIREEYYFLAVGLSIVLYFHLSRDYEGLAWVAKWTLLFIGVTAIMSIYSSSINSMAGRLMINRGGFKSGEFEKFERLGGGSHELSTVLGGLFPMMVYYFRNHIKSIFSKRVILIYGIICFLAVLRIQIFANILLSTLVIIISLLGRENIKQSIVIVVFFLIIIFIIPLSIYADLLVAISHSFDEGSVTYTKLNDMASFLSSGDYNTGAGARAERYPLLLEAFVKNPVLGYFSGNHIKDISPGGHLYWMNKLTILGLVGFIPFVAIHFSYIKSAVKHFDREFTFYFMVSVFAILGLGFIKNLAGRELWFFYFIILPGLYFLPLLKKKKKNSNPN